MKISVSLLALRALLELADSLRPLAILARQIAAEGEALALQAGSHQREHDRGGADERHHAEALAVRGFDERGAGIGDRRAAGFGQQAQRTLFAQRREQDRRSSPITLMFELRATGMPSAPRNARALFAFSTTKSRERRALSRAPSPAMPPPANRPSGVGMQ